LNKSNRKIIFIFTFCILPIILGGFIYIAFRSTSLLMFEWFSIIGLDVLISKIRYFFLPMKTQIPSWFYLSLPDGIWVFSLTSSLAVYWNFDFYKARFWLLFPLLLGVFVEVLQRIGMFPGTFDVLDLIFSTAGFSISLLFFKIKFRNYYEK